MKTETIFNIFPICNNDIISLIGFRVHELAGTDEEKTNFLLSRVEIDISEMKYISISKNYKVNLPNGEQVYGLTLERYNNLVLNGTVNILYEPIFDLVDTPGNPLIVTTMIVDGQLNISKQIESETNPKTSFTENITESVAEHYLSKFVKEDGFHLGDLINEDFIEGIRILFQNKKYVSCLKLLMSAIDTFALVEYGDEKDNFKKWLTNYCDLGKTRVTEEQLWELRNSILHMTNSLSRKVIQKNVIQLKFYVSDKDVDFMRTDGETNYFNLLSLIKAINKGIENWGNSFNDVRNKYETFCDRYDTIISDSRYNKLSDKPQ